MNRQASINSLAIITSQAFSMRNFRGPLIKELVSRGIRCYALAPDYTDKIRRDVIDLGAEPVDIRMQRAKINPARDIIDMFSLVFTLHRLKPNVSLGYFIKPVIFGTLAARLANIPHRYCIIEGAGYIFSVDDNPVTIGRKMLKVCVYWLYKFSLHFADRVFLLNSDDERQFVDDLRILDSQKAILIPGIGIDLDAFKEQPPVKTPITFILVARMLAQKGIREYMAAAKSLHENHPDVRFLLVGDVDNNPDSLDRDEIMGWANNGIIEWIGHVDDVRPWIGQSSVMVLPSYYREGMPRSLLEAMAMGRPIITTDMPGCRETVIEGKNGYLVSARDHSALVDAMSKFIKSPDLISTMGKESRLLAEKRFNVDKINQVIISSIGIS